MLEILYKDKDIIVVNKPAGVPVETKRIGVADLESMVKNELKNEGANNVEVHVINRLDQPVSGIVLMALNQKSAAALSKDLQQNMIDKYYFAKVAGNMVEAKGQLTDMLYKDAKNNMSMVVKGNDSRMKQAKKAILEYEVIGDGELNIHLITGRHHQIRVQLANAGCPILGDNKYGTKESKDISKEKGIEGLCLKSYRLEFNHPSTMERMKIEIDK